MIIRTFISFSAPCLLLLATTSVYADTACKLRGGSVVPLPAEACKKEGGKLVQVAAPAVTPVASSPQAAVLSPVVEFSSEPGLAAAQKPIAGILGKPVTGDVRRFKDPEGVERKIRFDGCKLHVEESLRVDYGNLIAVRKEFRIVTEADFAEQGKSETGKLKYSKLGQLESKGGNLKVYAVQMETPRRGGSGLTVKMEVKEGDMFRTITQPDGAPYWYTDMDYYWMADGLGYPKGTSSGEFSTGWVRTVFIVEHQEDAEALAKAFADLHTACSSPAR